MAAVTQATAPKAAPSREDETLLVLARLMEGGQEDDETIRDLDQLTKLLNEDIQLIQAKTGAPTICKLIDSDCVDTVLTYLDMRQPEIVRAHAVIATSAYLKAAGDDGAKKLSGFFFDKIKRGTYDDYIVAFCVAASTFPVVPDLTAELFLSEGFLSSLGPLMRRKWKSRKVETACLEMLNAACMNSQCRDAVNKYCTEWLEEVVDQDPDEIAKEMQQDPEYSAKEGSVAMRKHSEQVQNLAAVILAKLRNEDGQGKISPAITTIEELSTRFTSMLLSEDDHGHQHSIEGLAYASIQPAIKEKLAGNADFLKKLVKTLADAPPKSPVTYGALSILVNLTRYQPNLTEEEKKMNQLKAYAAAAGKSAGPDPLNDNDHVTERCKRVFEAGVTPVLVTHSKNGSPASLSLTVAIIYSLSVTTSLRGKLAQQGAVKLLLAAWATLPESEDAGRRTAAQALARILISTNPAIVFGGSRSNPQSSAIRPLISIIPPDPAAETRDLLPTFEALMALTNLASTDDLDTRRAIVRVAWPQIEDQLLCSNARVSKAAVELVCNLVQAAEGMALYADGSPQAKGRLHILLALADAKDEGTRSAAGGALAALTGHENVVQAIVERERGVKVILDMCADDNEDLRHRAGFIVYNMVAAEGAPGANARKKIIEEGGLEALKEAAKKSRRAEVVEVLVQALKVLLEDNRALEG
ncbi:actin cytoskeleton organization protein [Colletotrichum tofieldiae]|nr:actin cytoskeleton organization protein [Colletotrichum tofieldiae]GKT78855.1 actin cytoskeleton organization protein [Colletotrichum tofieldiae]GKT86931.1 actin cytoskeleton organization protein [Colletotrichum tofieldiae]